MNAQLIATYNEIANAINFLGNRHPLETVNDHMRNALVEAFQESNTRDEFIKKVKKSTGLTSHGIKSCSACQYLLNSIQ